MVLRGGHSRSLDGVLEVGRVLGPWNMCYRWALRLLVPWTMFQRWAGSLVLGKMLWRWSAGSSDGVLEVVRRVHPVQCHEQHYLRRHSLPLAKMCALSWVDNRSGMMIIEGVAQLTTWHLPREVLDSDTGVTTPEPAHLNI